MNDFEFVRSALRYADEQMMQSPGAMAAFERIVEPRVEVAWDPPRDVPISGGCDRHLRVGLIVGETLYSETTILRWSAHDMDGRLGNVFADDLERRQKARILHAFGRKVELWPR